MSRLQYATNIRLIRVMCTGRIDLAHIFRSFSKGADGVFIGGCRLNECNYVTQGNFHALNMVLLSKKIIEHLGLNPERLRIEFLSSGEGTLFAELVDSFTLKVKEAGPFGKGEGLDESVLMLRLEAVTRQIPYLRLVEGERLRVKFDTAEEYESFYAGEELDRLFRELIADKLAMGQIIQLLQTGPHSAAEIAELLDMTPSEVSRQLNSSAEHGLVRYEDKKWHFA